MIVTIGGYAGTEVSVDETSLTFTPEDWGTAQTVEVTAREDDDAVNDTVTLTHTSAGGGYDRVTADGVTVTVTDNDTARLVLSETALTIAEGESAEYTVKLASKPAARVAVRLGVPAGADLSSEPSRLVFDESNWNEEQRVEVTTYLDDDGADDTATITHMPLGGDYGPAHNADLSITITDPDTPMLVITPDTLTLNEGTTADYTVKLATEPTDTVEVTITGEGDVGVEPEQITFTVSDWNNGKTVTATADEDDDVTNDSVTLSHTGGGGDYNSVSKDLPVTVTDTSARIVLSATAITVHEEGDDVSYTVKLAAEPTGLVTVTITGAQGTPLSVDDASLDFTVDTWNIEQEVIVSAEHDDDGSANEITLTHSAGGGGYDNAPDAEIEVAVIDNDTAEVIISKTALNIDEGGDGTYTIKLKTKPTGNVLVTINDPSNTDVTAAPASASFTTDTWNNARTVTVSAKEDDDDTTDEAATVTHTVSGADYEDVTAADVRITVIDNDDPQVTVSFGASAYTAPEGGTVEMTVKLSADPERDVVIPLTSAGQDGASGADYDVPASVTFESGDTEKSFAFTAEADDVDDDGESVKLTLGALPTGVMAGDPDESTVSITDDDDPQVTVAFGASAYSVAEGGTVVVTVSLSADPERDVVVPLTSAGQDGASGADYDVPASVTFESGDTEKSFAFTAEADDVDDDGESVKLTLGALPTGVMAGDPDESTVSITDDDDPQVTVAFGASAYSVAEGGTVVVTVSLSADPERDVVVPLTSAGQDGASGADYDVPASVTFESGDTEKSFAFTAEADDVDDDGESVKLTLGALPTGVMAGDPDESTVSITDDDDPQVTVAYGASAYTAAEGGTVEVTVSLSADPEREVVIPLIAAGKGGATGADYDGVPASVTFNSGDTEQSFTFEAAADDVDDDGESVKLTFGVLPTGVTAGATAESTVSITDDDDPPVTVSFGASAYSVAEGGTVEVTVRLSADPERDVEILLTSAGQGGATGADFDGVPESVTFGSGDISKSFTFEAEADDVDDDGESVELGFGTLPAGVTAGATAESTVSITDDDDPLVTVAFGASSYSVAEGGTVVVTVRLSADPERDVEILLINAGQGGATGADFDGVPESVTFGSGDISKSFTFEAEADDVDDDGESVKLTFGVLPAGVTAGATAESTVSITDDDDPLVMVAFGALSYSVAEGGTVVVTVRLSADPERDVEILLTSAGQGGATGADYDGVPASVTFNSGVTEKSFTFTAEADDVDDDGESVELGFGSLPAGVTAGATAESTVSITDDDDPQVTVAFGASSYSVAEGGTVVVTVSLSADPERDLEILLTSAGQGGATGADYDGVPASVTFNSGVTEKSFTFEAEADDVDDDGESVELGFGSLPAGVTEGATDESTVSITDDDDPGVTVAFGASSYSVAEGGTVVVTVKLSADPERDVVVPLTATGEDGATSADFDGVPASVTFNSGDTEKSFTFNARDDVVDDDGESVRLAFGSMPTGVTVDTTIPEGESQARDTATVSIGDDDKPASVTANFGQDSYTAAEGGSVTVKVTLSDDPEMTVTVPLTVTEQGGATGVDYSGVPATLTFESGDTEKSFTFEAADDAVDDDGESVKLAFGTLPAAVTGGDTAESTVSITDDDDPGVRVSFGASSYSAAEGDTVEVTIVLSADPERRVVIPLTKYGREEAAADTNFSGSLDDFASSVSDYSGVPATLTFESGDTEKSFTFRATDDSVDDDGESVRLGFGTMPTGVTVDTAIPDGESQARDTATVTIGDDDKPVSVAVNFDEDSYTAAEGGTVTVRVTLSDDPEMSVTVPLTATEQGGATGVDYSGVPATLTFESGDTEKSFTFRATDDSVDDDGESVKLAFGILPAGVTAGDTDESTVSITDDDDPGVAVSFGQAAYTAAEGGTVVVTVKLSADPEREVVIPLTATEEGGATSVDYRGVPASLTFDNGETEKTFTFRATDDSVDDDGESVKLGFGTLPGGVTGGDPAESTVSITDDDKPASVTANFGQDSYTAAEGGSVTVKVTLSDDPEMSVTVPLTVTEQGGATGADYSGVPVSVVFNSGDTEKSFTFEAAVDAVDDDGESVKLGFGSLSAGVTAGDTAESTVSITDDDDPGVQVSFGASSYAVAEGGTVVVTITLSADPEREVVIPLAATEQGGATSVDYRGVPASLTFDNGETEKTFTFRATDDSVDDDGESVKLGFGALPDGVTAGDTAESTVSIGDDDKPASVTANFGQDSYTAAEGGSVTVKVTLSDDPEMSVTVPLTVTEQGGATGVDYSGVPATLTFESGDTEKSFTFEATDDAVDDDGESVKLGFGILPAGVTGGDTDESTVSITDDDDPGVAVSFGASSYSAAEGESVTVTIVLSADPERRVVIPLTKYGREEAAVDTNFDGSLDEYASSATDYSGVPATLTFERGETEKTFTFAATDDSVDDDGESVKLGFGALPGGVTAGDTAESSVSIGDDDKPVSVAVNFDEDSYTLTEGGTVTVKVALNDDPEMPVTVPLTATEQGGATGVDYSGVPATLTFESGDTEKSFTFEAADDAVDDDGESVKLAFGTLPAAVTAGDTAESTVSISDDDDPGVQVSFGQAAYTAEEGGTVVVTVKLSADPERQVVIPLTKYGREEAAADTNFSGSLDDYASSATDYSGVPATLTFERGDTEKTFTFRATDDSVDDDGESVKLGFGTLPAAVTAGDTAESTVSIGDDDKPASVTVNFDEDSYTVTEGGTVTVKVTLNDDPEMTVTVPLTATEQGGASGVDYSGVPVSVMFNAGDTEKSFTFNARVDAVDDDGESVKLGFGSLPAGVTAGDTAESTVSITDDDDPGVAVSFGASSYAVAEGGTVVVTITLSADPEREVVIPLAATEQGGATSVDYRGVPASLTFDNGETEKTFTFRATDDSVDDDGESVKLAFGAMPTGVTVDTAIPDGETQSRDTATVSITDDDKPVSVTANFEQDSYTAVEGGTVTLKVTLSDDPEMPVTVPLTATEQGGATGADYSGVPASVRFNAGDTEKSFTFEAEADDVDDDGESVKLTFGVLPTGVTAGATAESTVSITDDDDPAVTVAFGASAYSVAEGGTVEVTVSLSADPERDVVIPLTTVNQGGATGADYDGVPASVTFNSGDTEKTFTFTAKADDTDDDGESVELGFGALPAGVTAGGTAESTVSITDDDDPGVTVAFGASAYSVVEGGTVEVTVKLSAEPERDVVIPLTTAEQDGATGADYDGVPASVMFESGVTEKEFTFTAEADDVDDDGESVKLGFGTLPAGVTAGDAVESTVSIGDDDAAGVTVTPTRFTVLAGESNQYTVVLDSKPTGPVTVTVSGHSGTDLSVNPSTLIFSAENWDMPRTVAVTAIENATAASVTLEHAVSGRGYSEVTADDVTVTIVDAPGELNVQVGVTASEQGLSVPEGGSNTYSVVLSTVPGGNVTVGIDLPSGTDLSIDPSDAELVFTPENWHIAQTVTVTAAEDDDATADELVLIGHTVSGGGYDNAPAFSVAVTITENDTAGVKVSESLLTIDEGGDGTYTVKLKTEPTGEVVVTVNDPSNTDVTAEPAFLTFTTETWNDPQTVTVFAKEDDDDTADEEATVTHTVSGADYEDVAAADVGITVIDNDDPQVTAGFGASSYTAAEGGTVEVTVKLSADPERDVVIPLTTAGQDGATGADYEGVPASVTFESGDTEKSFTFEAEADDVDDDGESVKLTFGVLPAGVTAGATDESTVSITDDDDPAVTVSFGAPSYTAAEGGTVVVTVELSADPERDLVIPLTTANQGGATGADYDGVPASVTFNSGVTEQSFTFEAEADDVDDDGESVKLGFGTLPAGVTAGATDESTVSITDNDDPQVTVSFGASSYTVAEGGTVEVTVSLSADPERDVVIPLTTAEQDGATGDDYGGVPASVTFNAGDTEKSFTFEAADDSVDDDGESVKLGFGSLPTGVAAGTTDESVVSITDDDDPQVEVSFGSATYSATEGGDDALITVRLSVPAPSQVDIPLTAVGYYKATPADWSGVPAVLTFSVGDTSKSFTLIAYDDTVEDDGEMVELGLGALPDGFVPGSPVTTRVTLMNDDAAPVNPQIEPDGLADFATLCGDTRASLIIGTPFAGRIGFSEDIDAIQVAFTAGSNGYRVSLRDGDNEQISAEDFYIGMVHPDDEWMHYVSYDYLTNWKTERDTLFIIPEQTGTYCVEIRAKSEGFTGDYTVLVAAAEDPLANPVTGAESASPGGDAIEGIPLDTSHFHRISVGTDNAIAGEIKDSQDSDWYITQLAHGLYRVTVEGYGTGNGTLVGPGLRLRQSDTREFVPENADYKYVPIQYVPRYGSYWIHEFQIEESSSGSDIFHFEVWSTHGNKETYTVTLEAIEEFTYPQEQTRLSGRQKSNTPATGAPGISGTPRVGETLAATTSFIADEDGLTHTTFTYQWIRYDLTSATDADIDGATDQTYTVTDADDGLAIKVRVTFTDDAGNEESLTSYAILPAPVQNTLPEGRPVITGTARVGEALIADITRIADADGLDNADFNYQWLADDTAIHGATGSTYTPVDADEGKIIRVRVTFTDDFGNGEALISAATDAVDAAHPPLTAGLENTPDSHDGENTFTFNLRFSEEIGLSHLTLRDHAFTVVGGSVEVVQRIEPPHNIRWRITVRPGSKREVVITLPATEGCETDGAICTEDGRNLSNRLVLTVTGPPA